VGAEQIIREHAALRRVATLVAQQPSPAEVFAAVTEETGRLLGVQTTNLMRVETPALAVIVAGWSEGAAHVPVGSTGLLDGRGLVGKILDTGRPSRVEDFDDVGGAVAASMRSLGLRSGAAGPVVVGGRIWGALVASPPPAIRCRTAPRTGSRRSRSSCHSRSKTPRTARSSRPPARGWSRPPTRRAGGSSATCTTAPNSALSRQR
jgi:hypothetical protein